MPGWDAFPLRHLAASGPEARHQSPPTAHQCHPHDPQHRKTLHLELLLALQFSAFLPKPPALQQAPRWRGHRKASPVTAKSPKTLSLKTPGRASHACLENQAQKYLQSTAIKRPLEFCGYSLNMLFLSLSTFFFSFFPKGCSQHPWSLCWHQPNHQVPASPLPFPHTGTQLFSHSSTPP